MYNETSNSSDFNNSNTAAKSKKFNNCFIFLCFVLPKFLHKNFEFIIVRGQKYSLIQLIVKGKFHGKRIVGTPKMLWQRNFREQCGPSRTELVRAVANKVRIVIMVPCLQ